MRYWWIGGFKALLAGLCLCMVVGCDCPPQAVRVDNDTDHPIVSARLIPFSGNAAIQAQGLANTANLLPRDAHDQAIALLPGDSTTAVFQKCSALYLVETVLYQDGAMRKYLDANPVDLSFLPPGALLFIQVQCTLEGDIVSSLFYQE